MAGNDYAQLVASDGAGDRPPHRQRPPEPGRELAIGQPLARLRLPQPPPDRGLKLRALENELAILQMPAALDCFDHPADLPVLRQPRPRCIRKAMPMQQQQQILILAELDRAHAIFAKSDQGSAKRGGADPETPAGAVRRKSRGMGEYSLKRQTGVALPQLAPEP